MDPYKGYVDLPMSNYALRYRNNAMLADIVAPRVTVGQQSGFYWIYGREDQQGADVDDRRAPGAAALRIKRTQSKDNFFCPDHAVEDVIADEEPAIDMTAEPPEQASTRIQMNQLLLRHEKRTATLLTTAANFSAGLKVQLAGNDQWDSGDAASDPFEDVAIGVNAIEQAAGVKPNVLVLGNPVYKALRRHPQIIERIKYNKIGNVTADDLAAFFDVERVLVGAAIQRSDAGVNSFIWGNHAVLMYVNPQPSQMDVSAAKTFVWGNAPGTVGGFKVQRGRAAPVSRSADEISTHFYHDEKITAQDTMYLIEDAV